MSQNNRVQGYLNFSDPTKAIKADELTELLLPLVLEVWVVALIAEVAMSFMPSWSVT